MKIKIITMFAVVLTRLFLTSCNDKIDNSTLKVAFD